MIKHGGQVSRAILSLLAVAGLAIVGMSAQARGAVSLASGRTSAQQSGPVFKARVVEEPRHAPLMFVENVGQFAGAPGPRFLVRGAPGGIVWLAEEAMWITLLEGPPSSSRGCGLGEEGESGPRRGVNLKLTFVDANPRPQILPFDRLETRLSYLRGNDPASWHRAVSVWAGVRYVDLYPGVDLEVGTGLAPVPGRLQGSPLPWRLIVREATPSSALPLVGGGVRVGVCDCGWKGQRGCGWMRRGRLRSPPT